MQADSDKECPHGTPRKLGCLKCRQEVKVGLEEKEKRKAAMEKIKARAAELDW